MQINPLLANMTVEAAKELLGGGDIEGYRLPIIELIERQQAEIERLAGLWRQAIVDMESCACEWEPDPNNPDWHTDKIRVLCGAHEELFEQRTEQLRASNVKLLDALKGIAEYDCPAGVARRHCAGCPACDASAALADAQHPEQQPDKDAQTK